MLSVKQIIELLRRPWPDKWNRLHEVMVRVKTELYYRPNFGALGRGCRIYKPLLLANPRFLFVGSNVLIRPGARIETIVLDKNRPPALLIGNNVNIEQNVHLVCSASIVIGDDVSIGPNCGILDTSHPFSGEQYPRKIGDRVNSVPSPVEIGSNTLIGFGVAILPDVRIGTNCVIGANSTVTKSIPDFCLAAGNPAKVILSYKR
jgi:acetyltransferase-like isoleucine patch superfamily enzyme